MRFCFETLGCKVNQFETQALEAILVSRGHTPAKAGEGCDAVIVNTCAVTADSGRKSRQTIRRLKRLEPDAVAAVCGCLSQISPEDFGHLGVDLISGSGDRLKFVDDLERVYNEKASRHSGGGPAPFVYVGDPPERREFEELPAGSVPGRTRALLKIQDGCRNFCAYCVIPYARGPARSLPLARVAAQAARLGREGYREIVVTGIEISSYGMDFGDGTSLIHAIEAISTAAPAARLRLGSLEPRTITGEFCAGLKKLPNICDHFHLSLQSGCDETLERMKRRYTTEEFYSAVCLLRRYYPNCGITADLIVGFPGETEEEFEKTLAFIKKCAFSSMHIFPYSRRRGTPAADMPGQVPKAEKRERARRASEAAREMARSYAASFLGSVLSVLFEREEGGVWYGHAGNYLEAAAGGTDLKNKTLPVRIACVKERLLFGEIVWP
ncbi:MAG: tRNA (N(6)-L-threonylcarbamoyladenosine(37)-C(2))-methylthiotransferase MtaB [Clostridiales bacterium]|nr:tRNA (N(6)-L-threonylcarbamoyladenosine(37)-C(2))-methylthiotransferase MtaB [Clostridiales bacterium]